jgi:tRNA-splicing ligase RtcB
VWVVLHSGSRGIGNQLAQAHIARARRVAQEAMLSLEDPDLAYFVQGTAEFEAYIAGGPCRSAAVDHLQGGHQGRPG